MAEQEQRRPQSPQFQLTEGSSLRLSDGTHNLEVRKEGEILLVQISRNEQPFLSIAVSPDSQVHQVFIASGHTTTAGEVLPARANTEHPPAPENPPVTIEGFAGRLGSYRDSKIRPGNKEYYVYLYYRPMPEENWDFVVPYHVHFFGAAAEQLKERQITTGARLRITGELHTREVTDKNSKEKKPHFDMYTDQSPDFFRGKPKPMEGETRRQK